MAMQAHVADMANIADWELLREQAYVGGKWRDADDGDTITVTDPATGEPIGTVPSMGAAETRQAIEAAEVAWPDWRAQTAKERAGFLRRWFEEIVDNAEELAVIMTAEEGKPIIESRKEIAYGASFIEWFAEEATRTYGEVIPPNDRQKRILVIRQPVGVVAAITPWNFPNAMITRKCAPALAAGCPVVVKPASRTPFSALALAALAEQAGLPGGVINIVTGPASEIGGELTANETVRKLSFTGSTEVGRKLMAQCSDSIKKLSLELGGNAPFIVFADADLSVAVEAAIQAKFRNSGESCIAANRFLVHDAVYDEFVDRFAAEVKALRVGNGFEDGVEVGPLIDENAVAKVEQHVQDAVSAGAKLLVGGERFGKTGYSPTVLSEVTSAMPMQSEETFGPVAPVMRFSNDEEAVRIANATEYGLAAYFCTSNAKRIWRISEALEYGMVGVNTGLISNAAAPFGGIKQSGLGREGSRHGIEEYQEIKYVCVSDL